MKATFPGHHLRDEAEQSISINSAIAEKQSAGLESKPYHIFRETAAGLSSRTDIIKKNRVSPDHIHEVIFAIQQKNVDLLTSILHDISDPNSENYGKHRTREEIEAISDNPKAHKALLNYLHISGVDVIDQSLSREFITVQAPISFWEKELNTEFYVFHHTDSSKIVKKVARAEHYSVPRELHEHIAAVFHTVQMPMAIWSGPVMRPVNSQIRNNSNIHAKAVTGFVTPTLLNKYYIIKDNSGSLKSTQAAFETIGQYFSPKDLVTFQQRYGITLQPVSTFIGGHVDDNICITDPESCTESNLDIQYLMATCRNAPTTHLYTDSNSFANWLLTVANMANPPLVLSISYGATEDTVTASEFDAFNVQAIKLGMMGISIFAASGDDGVLSHKARDNKALCAYKPLFPASSPYVTAVGATQGPESGTPEIVCQRDLGGVITSGGGFSSYYSQPYWQSGVITSYFRSVRGTSKEPVTGYQRLGRGYPDISLVGNNYMTSIGGKWFSVSGTSASCPVMAGMVSIINSARMKLGKTSVGWLNPTLYYMQASFVKDITSGKNNCDAGDSATCCTQGFHATPGWDPTTGLGSLNFDLFRNTIVALGSGTAAAVTPARSPVKTMKKPQTTATVGWLAGQKQHESEKPSVKPSSAPFIRKKGSKQPSALNSTLRPSQSPSSASPSGSPSEKVRVKKGRSSVQEVQENQCSSNDIDSDIKSQSDTAPEHLKHQHL